MSDRALSGGPRSPGLPVAGRRSGPAERPDRPASHGQRPTRIDLAAAERVAAAVQEALDQVPDGRDPVVVRPWLRTVESLLSSAGEHDRARLLQARAGIRTATDPHGRCNPAEAVLADAATAAELFEQMGEPLPAATNFAAAASAAAQTGRIPLALETAVRALVALGDVPPGGGSYREAGIEAGLAARLGALCRQFLDYPRALRFYELALAASGEEHGDGAPESGGAPAMAAIADVLLARVAELPRDGGERAALLARAGELARQLVDPRWPEAFRLVHGPRLLADTLCERGLPERAGELLAAIPPELSADLAGPVHLSRGRCLVLLGRSAQAVTELDRALEVLTAESHLAERLQALRLRSQARQDAGDAAGALADARSLADLLWARHQRQVGSFLDQVWSRAGVEGERRGLEARTQVLQATAEQDPLTGLANRRAVERFCAGIGPGGSVSLVLVDVDHFKSVNDRFGHAVGDAVLREMATLLTRSVRSMDVVARWGGEEFLIALPGGAGRLGVDAAARMCRRVRDHRWARLAPGLHLTVSAGVAGGTAADLETVLQRADTALYAAKAAGRDRAVSR